MKPEDFVTNLQPDQHDIETEERKHQEDVEEEMVIEFKKKHAIVSITAVIVALLVLVIVLFII